MPLVEKVTEILRCWSAKLLSYAGRLQLIKAVVFGVRTCWAQSPCVPGENLSLQSSRGTKGHASDLLEQSCNPETFMGYSRNIVHCVAGSAKEAWVGVHRATGSWTEVVQWMSNWAKKKFGTGAILSCIFAMLVATIWRDRNRISCPWQSQCHSLIVVKKYLVGVQEETIVWMDIERTHYYLLVQLISVVNGDGPTISADFSYALLDQVSIGNNLSTFTRDQEEVHMLGCQIWQYVHHKCYSQKIPASGKMEAVPA
ncbi:hypothetical protein KY289_029966 [Solanum tuberosum]|nr:hypothetical protein KY289_029966 [Solanum tuberosum]